MFDWSIYLSALHMIGRSKMNERVPGMTQKGMFLDVSVSPFVLKIQHAFKPALKGTSL